MRDDEHIVRLLDVAFRLADGMFMETFPQVRDESV